MDEQLKQRLVGAAVLVLLAVIFVPMILDRPPEPEIRIEHPTLPSETEADFSSRIVPLTEPKTPLVEVEPKPVTIPRSKPAEATEPSKAITAAAKGPAEKTLVEKAPAKKAPAKKEAMEKAPVKKAAAEEQTPAPAPVKEPDASAVGSVSDAWAVQLGSFSVTKNATTLRDKLKDMGYVAFVKTARLNGKEIKRVLVGPELTREQATELVKKLQAETDLKGIVVRYPRS